MKKNERDIEILISRHLDGALSEDEALALNREMIRDPEAHRMMDQCQKIDTLAKSALKAAIPNRGATSNPAAWIAGRRVSRAPRFRRSWWLVPGAVAAALLAVMVNQATLPVASEPNDAQPHVNRQPIGKVVPGPQLESGNDIMRNAAHQPVPRQRIDRNTARDVYGIIGDDGQIYWIEVDRIRTIRRPNAGSTYKPVSQEL